MCDLIYILPNIVPYSVTVAAKITEPLGASPLTPHIHCHGRKTPLISTRENFNDQQKKDHHSISHQRDRRWQTSPGDSKVIITVAPKRKRSLIHSKTFIHRITGRLHCIVVPIQVIIQVPVQESSKVGTIKTYTYVDQYWYIEVIMNIKPS